MSQLLTYETFYTKEETKELTDLLDSAGILYEVEHNKNLLDKVYIGENLDPLIAVKIPSEHFEYVNEIVKDRAKSQVHNINPDYYLFQFSNEELIEVVKNKNEWNAFDQGLAEAILNERKVNYNASREKPVTVEYTPIRLEPVYLVLEYLLSIILPYAGIIIGLATITAFRTLHNGQKVKMYDEQTRQHAKIMLVIGIFRSLITFLFSYPLWFLPY